MRKRSRSRSLAACAVLAFAVGCPLADVPEPVSTRVGVHRVRFVVPPGWLHVDHGREQRFEKGIAQISFSDLGPATPEGLVATLRDARTLFEADQWEDARTLLVASHPRRFFRSEARWAALDGPWKSVTRIRRVEDGPHPGEVDYSVQWEVEAAFHTLIAQVKALPPPDLETLARGALPDLGHDALRDIASLEATSVSGRPALRIETWDRLSHLHRRRHLFVLSEARLLCLRTELGRFETLAPAFEALATSLELAPIQGSGGA